MSVYSDLKKAEYMEKFVGKTFEGKISSITNFGMFITLPNTIEGLVRLKDMSDDYYIFNPTLYILKGERTNKRYRIGDDVLVKVVRSDKKMREIDFKLVYNSDREKHSYYKQKRKNQNGKNKESSVKGRSGKKNKNNRKK